MLLFYYINLVKLEIFWLPNKVEMTYNLEWMEYYNSIHRGAICDGQVRRHAPRAGAAGAASHRAHRRGSGRGRSATHVATLLAVNCGGASLAADLIARFSSTLLGVGVTQVGFSLLQVHVFWFLVQRIS